MTRPDGSPELRRRRPRGGQPIASQASSTSNEQEQQDRVSRRAPLSNALLNSALPGHVFPQPRPPARIQAPLVPTNTTAAMPYFLQLNDMDIARKFNDLNTRERMRMDLGYDSPTGSWAVCNEPECLILDRYMNVQPWAKNRCKLKVPAGQNNYVNASPISLHELGGKSLNKFKYIAMQGPKYNTISHTWRLIWEQTESPAVIVMLTDLEEAGREKCAPYFPKDADCPPVFVNYSDEFGDGFLASVNFVEEDKSHHNEGIELRKLVIRKQTGEKDSITFEEKIVWHLLYTRWPDFGVPAIEELDSFFALMELSREKNTVPGNPRIVHCSAGVGRSGTFIALEFLMGELEAGGMVYYDGRDESFPHLQGPMPSYYPLQNYFHYGPPLMWGLQLPPSAFNLPQLMQNTVAYDQRYMNAGVGSQVYQAAEAAGEKDLIYETVDNLRIQRKMMVQADIQYQFLYQVLKRCWELKYRGVAGPMRVESQDPFI